MKIKIQNLPCLLTQKSRCDCKMCPRCCIMMMLGFIFIFLWRPVYADEGSQNAVCFFAPPIFSISSILNDGKQEFWIMDLLLQSNIWHKALVFELPDLKENNLKKISLSVIYCFGFFNIFFSFLHLFGIFQIISKHLTRYLIIRVKWKK